MRFPEDLHYHPGHAWARIEDGVATIGITDHAQKELGDIVFVELPETGKKVESGKSFGTIEAVKAVSDLYAPVSGEIVEVNAQLKDKPEVVNKDPYGAGWMVKIKIATPGEVDALMDASAYTAIVGS